MPTSPFIPHSDWCLDPDGPLCSCAQVREDISQAVCSDLGGTAEVATALGVPRQTLTNWRAGRARTGFPEPLFELRATPVWSVSACVAWYDRQSKPRVKRVRRPRG